MKHLIRKLLREGLMREEEYFTAKLPDDVKRLSKKYVGRGVTWYGDPDQMIVLHKSKVEGMWGNIYYPEKLEYIQDLIHNSEENVELECSYGIGSVIDITDITEEQTSYVNGEFEINYEQLSEPRSTGDEELDLYLGTEDLSEFDEISMYVDNYDLFELYNNYKTRLGLGHSSVDEVKNKFKEMGGTEEDIESLNKFIEFEGMIKSAIDDKEGDIGTFMVQLRDGHHRVMGAIAAGEEYICLNLAKDDINTFKGYYQKV